MGFCIFANAALAGLYSLDMGGLDRIAFVVGMFIMVTAHQEIFGKIPGSNNIPSSGKLFSASDSTNEIGAAKGIGTNLNIPLPPGCGSLPVCCF